MTVDGNRLVARVAATSDAEALRKDLESSLPAPLVPDEIVVLDPQ